MSPVADAYTATPNELSSTYPLQLAVCSGCHLVQLFDVLPQDVLFGTGYSFYSSASAPLSTYHALYASHVLHKYDKLARQLVVEIGCNDGDMLRHFDDANCRAIGVDPAGGPVEVALQRGLSVMNEPFTRDVASRIVSDYGHAGVVIANHVLAHVESVSDTLAGIAKLLADDGIAFIEVQYLPDLLLNNAFDLVYHEHRNFFTLSSLAAVARRWGLHVYDAELTERQGGSLRVTLGRTFKRASAFAEHLIASERWLSTDDAYGGLQGRANRMRSRLLDLINSIKYDGVVIGYGAPAKATTLLNFCDINRHDIPYVIDTTPAKHNRFIPGTGIEIIAPNNNDKIPPSTDAILLLAWNYARPIMRCYDRYTERGGRWIVPVPAPMVL